MPNLPPEPDPTRTLLQRLAHSAPDLNLLDPIQLARAVMRAAAAGHLSADDTPTALASIYLFLESQIADLADQQRTTNALLTSILDGLPTAPEAP